MTNTYTCMYIYSICTSGKPHRSMQKRARPILIDRISFVYFTGLGWSTGGMARNLSVTSVNEGRASGLADQHCSISFRQSGSQFSGIGGRSVLLTMPPSHNKEC
jgi:hypothetical protein